MAGFDVAIGVTRIHMRIHGIWPGFSDSKITLARYAFLPSALMILFFINTPQTVKIFHLNGDLNAILNVLTLGNVPISIALAKLLGVGYNQSVLHQLILLVSDDWNQTTKKSELTVMWEKAKSSRFYSIISIILGEGTAVAYTARMFYVLSSTSISSEQDTVNLFLEKPMYMEGKFPIDTQSSPNYEIIWVLQVIATFLAAGTFSAVDSLFITLVLHLHGQIINLQTSFNQIGDKKVVTEEETIKYLRIIVGKHRRINEFAQIMDYSFNLMFLFQVFFSTVLLCLQGYLVVIIISSGKVVLVEMIFMAYFTVCFTFSIFVYCFLAELLNEEAMKLSNSVFYSNWYDLPSKKAKLLMIPIMQIRRPLRITAGNFFVFSLNLFCNIVRTAAGYMSVLLAVRDKLVIDI